MSEVNKSLLEHGKDLYGTSMVDEKKVENNKTIELNKSKPMIEQGNLRSPISLQGFFALTGGTLVLCLPIFTILSLSGLPVATKIALSLSSWGAITIALWLAANSDIIFH